MFSISNNELYSGKSSPLFNKEIASKVRNLHRKIEGYQPTPLVSLEYLAKKLGLKNILVKDESQRFGLNAFKVLGGSYALAKLLAEKLNIDMNQFDLKNIKTLLKEPVVFTTATAGNHGTGVAWAAREMGQKAVVFMPKGAANTSVERIKALGADCIITDVNYDDTVRLANQTAHENGWLLVQDTAWDGYETIPTWISQGYMTMADEAVEQLNEFKDLVPTHIMLQAGVGAMAGGVLGYLVDALGVQNFKAIVSEPVTADCVYQSAQDKSGQLIAVDGDLNSIMAGLACGEVNPITWPILKDCTFAFAKVEDSIAATGMRILGNPLKGDEPITSGPSGAINLGLLYALSNSPDQASLKESLGLNEESVVLIFSTEGDTNTDLYRKVVWEGSYPY
ncbi:diaminopropionate ammonia-lyase [Acinetobacter baumannii]|uniref:diaminopropionate ammonia-lyase n=1 Tax=Acinetobacter baumannii TaxID=470 RepID=UPI0001AF2834|nr:diaminopropionate ammonia-lyase [Acinetobacter baumannii]EHU1904674.1 diaminopropionate ammonia-lyase [Acinetobacter baumannii]EHU1921157.1 diaminopropionate ammonia-lyase [Acinetobacter baumannii]EHU1965678.1 diaminopropionate ammonia-lyase [Acinetobacter baumannii]EKP42454.1 diaminopropionate ammonia-lyase [Acinetobacter baumannii OIFC111]EKU3892571.1 diaminopropionate ammonia-lyase [Acinetobacter baumannii]